MLTRVIDNEGAGRSLSWLQLRDVLSENIRSACRTISEHSPLTARDLQTVLLLHLPRFSAKELMNEGTVRYEAERLFHVMMSKRQDYFDWSNRPKIPDFVRDEITFGSCDEAVAQTIYERFHYIGECRRGIAHLALYHRSAPAIPMALMTISEMDIEHLRHWFGDQANKAVVISRSYAFDWAPRNSISFLTSRLRHWIQRQLPETAILLTYVNPNLGFTGVSYAAAGWQVVGPKSVKYRYYHDQYVTYRLMSALPESEKGNITTSSLELEPLNLLAVGVEGGTNEISHLKIDA